MSSGGKHDSVPVGGGGHHQQRENARRRRISSGMSVRDHSGAASFNAAQITGIQATDPGSETNLISHGRLTTWATTALVALSGGHEGRSDTAGSLRSTTAVITRPHRTPTSGARNGEL